MLVAQSFADRQDVLRRHAIARLAGQVSEMILVVTRFCELGHQVNWTRWRTRWIRDLLRRHDADIDFTFCALFAWGVVPSEAELLRQLTELWKAAETHLRRPVVWRQVELLAEVLARRTSLSSTEAIAALRPPKA
jgi:hypothetical protein